MTNAELFVSSKFFHSSGNVKIVRIRNILLPSYRVQLSRAMLFFIFCRCRLQSYKNHTPSDRALSSPLDDSPRHACNVTTNHTPLNTRRISQLDPNNKGSPIIVVSFMLQQINCIYSTKESDKIIEGSPDDIRQNIFLMGFQRSYDEVEKEMCWKCVDLQIHIGNSYI